MNRHGITAVILLIAGMLISPGLPTFPHGVHAQPFSQLPPFVGRVCIVPGFSTSCPQTLPEFPRASGGVLNVSINILGSTTFNAFNISVRWDPTIINATGGDLGGTILQTPNVTAQCINGSGFGCGALDGPGVATFAAKGDNTTAPAAGHLFRIVFGLGLSGSAISVGFQMGCSRNSIPNSDACVLIATGPASDPGVSPVPEGIQSQLLGRRLPTPFRSALPPGNITVELAGNSTDTYVTPYAASLPGNLTTWKAQFNSSVVSTGIEVPTGVQIKVFRRINATLLTVVGAGPLHNPRPVLQSRLPSYPNVPTEWTVMEFFSDPGIAVLPGDMIGLTIISDPSVGQYVYPGVNDTGTRFVQRNVGVGGTIDLLDKTFLPSFYAPAIQVFIQLPPPATDTAGDGISDFVKLSPEMRALGADPCRKTVAVQLDYMVRPLQAAINATVAAFDAAPVNATLPCSYPGFPLKPSGVKLIIDVDNAIPAQNVLNFTHSEPLSFGSVKAAFFDPNRVRYFHYGIFAHDLAPFSTVSGVAELFGPNFMVTLGDWPGGGSVTEQAGTLMHEIGHMLGLGHGGNNTVNFKPNYISVMNYAFQVVGITSQTPSGNVTRLDFSSQTLPSLNESVLDERVGLSSSNDITRWGCPDGVHVNFGLLKGPFDWNCNGQPDSAKVSVDINNDTSLETLMGFNDWANLRYRFTEGGNFGPGCLIGCEIGCNIGCEIGTELTRPQAIVIEAQWNAFLTSTHRLSSTGVSCNPTSTPIGTSVSCTASVVDTSTGAPVTPTGTVSFQSSGAGLFAPMASCALSSIGVCSVNYTPTGLGPQTVSVFYVGDANHTGSSGSGTVTGLPPVKMNLSKFFTSSDRVTDLLPADSKGNPKVVVVLASGVVKSTTPGEPRVWVNATNISGGNANSLTLNETLPVDWLINPPWIPGSGAIHVYFVYTNRTMLEITPSSMITTNNGNPQTVFVSIANIPFASEGSSLMPGESIYVSVKLQYGLKGTAQNANTYPRIYGDTARLSAWTQPIFTGSQSSNTVSAFFVAYPKVLGDVTGDFKVDILDVAAAAYAFGTHPGDALWNPKADFTGDGVIDILDVALAAFYFGTSS